MVGLYGRECNKNGVLRVSLETGFVPVGSPVVLLLCYWTARKTSSPSRGTNPPPNGGLFPATATTKPDCAGAGVLVPGSGVSKSKKNALFKRPHIISLSTARRPPPGVCTATRPLTNGATPRGRYPPTGGAACIERPYTSEIFAPALYRSSFVVVVSGARTCSCQPPSPWPSRRY